MVRTFKKETLTFIRKCGKLEIEEKEVLTIAEVENVNIKRFIYYLSKLSGNREDKKRRINKKIYEERRNAAAKIDTQNL